MLEIFKDVLKKITQTCYDGRIIPKGKTNIAISYNRLWKLLIDKRVTKTKFENRFLYYSEQPTFDADGYVINPVTLPNMKSMVQEVAAANQAMIVEAKVA